MNLSSEFRPTKYESYGLSGGYLIQFTSKDHAIVITTEQHGDGGPNRWYGPTDTFREWLSNNENPLVELARDSCSDNPTDLIMTESLIEDMVNRHVEWEDVAAMIIANALEMKKIVL